jgi:microsomal dipeptidase-like Zn-dependent dipeptidase
MHIDAICRAASASHKHVGIGSDLDGFIKPTMSCIESVADFVHLRGPLTEAYPDDVDAILGGNAERVLRKALRARA